MTEAVYYGGTVLTQDPSYPVAEAIAVEGGCIEAVGPWTEIEPLAGPGTKRFNLGGRTLLPGFNDAHVHVWKVGQLLTTVLDLRDLTSLDELRTRLVARDRELPDGTWLIGRGYNEALLREGRQPGRADLDAAVPNRPVALTRTCGHMMVVNSRVLELAGVGAATESPPGGAIARDASGAATGLLQETAMGLAKDVMPQPSVTEYREMLEAAQRSQLAKGITSASEAGAYVDLIRAYRELESDGRLQVRANVMAMRLADEQLEPLPLPERFVSPFLRVDSVKLFADGGLSGATAALRSRYSHADTKGLSRASADVLYEMAVAARDAGLRVCTHAIGDAAIDEVLATYERLGTPGNRIEHFGLPDSEQLARARRLGVIAAPQTIFIHSLGANFRRYLTHDYLARTYPIRSMLDAGIVVALSSDAPVVADDNPFLGMRAAVSRRDLEGEVIASDEAISVSEALYGYTMGGALASGDEENRGSLTAGKWADMIIVDRDPMSMPVEELGEIAVVETIVAGTPVYSG